MFGKKKNKYYGKDEDLDAWDDGQEVAIGRHSPTNKPRHLNVGGNLPNKAGILGIHHETLTNNIGKRGGLKMDEPKKMKMTIDIKQHKLPGMKEVRIPKAELKGDVKNFGTLFQEDYVNKKIAAILGKKRKKLI